MKPLLLVLDDWEGLIEASPCWEKIKEQVEIRYLNKPISSVASSEIANATFLMALRERTALTEEIFSKLPNLKLILQTGGHAYHIDTNAANKRGITIALGRKIKAPLSSVPELTYAMMLGLVHKVPMALAAMRKGEWPLLTGNILAGKQLGILGIGRHGTRVAQIAKAFNMDVMAWDRPGSKNTKADGIPRLSIEELLKTSDIVSIHLRLSPESEKLIDAEKLALMKKGAILINTSRGAIIDESALVQALQKGPLAGAGLDVFAHEPLPADSPLRSLPNVILTPHIGWTVKEVFEEFAQIASKQLSDYLNGKLDSSELLASQLH
jgi:phosphoglycerate dehydrogenase-like enzyme